MPNIFNGLNKMSDDDIRLQIALFQSVTVGNAVKETSYKAVGKIADFANKLIGKSIDNSDKMDHQVVGVEEIVLGKVKSLKGSSRLELDKMLRNILIEKCNHLNMDSEVEYASDDLLSILIIREAAKVYSLNTYMSPAKLADDIAKRYYGQFLGRLHKSLLKETTEEAKITDNNLQQYMNKASIESKRDMSKKIILKEFSGRGIGRLIRTETGIENITIVIECIGFDAFDILGTTIYSVYDTVLGLNRVSRAIFAQLVWTSVQSFGGMFTSNNDMLPNYVPVNMRIEQDSEEKEFLILLTNRKELEKNIGICKFDIEKITSKLIDLQVKLKEENEEYNESKAKFEELESKKHQYENNIDRPREEIKKYYADVISSKKKYDSSDLYLKKQTMQMSDLKIKLSERKTELERYNSEFAIVSENSNGLIIQKSTQLAILWKAYFHKFEFENNIFEQVVIDFTKAELLKIDEYLNEMQNSNDMDAFSIQTIHCEAEKAGETEENVEESEMLKVAICMVANGKNAEIAYKNFHIKSIRKQ